MTGLPEFVEPMLATRGKPFDSDEHLFEVKWDGFRAIALVEHGVYRLRSRRNNDMVPRYPELACLSDVEPGTGLDGELIVFREGKPDFEALLQREQARQPQRIKGLAGSHPVAYVAFDLLFRRFESVMDRPLHERRQELAEMVARLANPRLVCSDGITGAGRAFFEKATEQGLEGVVAKKLTSPYLPGKRTDHWTKIKRAARAHCAIIGYVPAGENDLKSLIIASNLDGSLRCVGKVGSGLGAELRARLLALLRPLRRESPLIECREKGVWVEPELYCIVTYVERTKSGNLRAPVFDELVPG